jgi:heat-inducible transcriptional repressor
VSADRTIPPEAAGVLQLDARSREIFRRIVDGYLATGDPVGSRNIARALPIALSPASVRNIMTDLEALGLIYAPHISAGRLPTELGLRFFVDAMLEVGDVSDTDRRRFDAEIRAAGQTRSFDDVLAEASSLLSGLSRGAGVVVASKLDIRLKHIEFLPLDPRRALVVLVADDGAVENRVVALPPGLPSSALIEASNFLNAHVHGMTLVEARTDLERARRLAEAELDVLTAKVVEAGLASWAAEEGDARRLIVRGQANLLGDLHALDDLERVRLLLNDLESKKDVIELLGRAENADGVRIFIGSENKLFSLSGSSLIAAPFRDDRAKVVGVVGVIGPTRLNYARIVPMVDYTAKLVGRVLGEG